MKYNVFFGVLVLAIVGFSSLPSCKDDDDGGAGGCSAAWANALSDEAAALSDAATAYGLDPTTAKCNAYKAAFQDYIDEAESFRNCSALTGQNRADWEAALQQAQDSLDALTC